LIVDRPFSSKATTYGRQNEPIARGQYEELMGVKVHPTGLTVLNTHHYIGATADGIVKQTVIEIKCPYRAETLSIDELISKGYEHVEKANVGYHLKESSPYYSQIQGEMAIKGCHTCHFVLWTPQDFAIISVPFNQSYWTDTLLPKLKSFFDRFIRPELLEVS